MKVLKLDLERFHAGFKAAEILDPYVSGFKEKYINNEYLEHFNDNYFEYQGVTELHRLQFLLLGIEIKAKIQKSRVDPFFRDIFSSYSRSFLVDMERFRRGEKVDDEILFCLYFLYEEDRELFDKDPLISKLSSEIDIDFIAFLFTVINSLYIDNFETDKVDDSILYKIKKLFGFKNVKHNLNIEDLIPPFVGVMDKISSKIYKKEKLSLRQKYIVISKLIYLCFKKNKINNKDLLESGLQWIIFFLIDRTDAECDYLQKTGKEGGYAAFLNSKSFRSPMSAKAVQDMYCNIEYIYQKKDILDRMAAREVQKQIFDEPFKHIENIEKKRKEWKKQEFIDMLKKYKNQSEMARKCQVSRQRISELKKKFKIKEL